MDTVSEASVKAADPQEDGEQDGETLDVESVDSNREKALVEKVVLPADQQWYLSTWKNRYGSIHLETDDPALQGLQSIDANDHNALEIEVSAEPDALAAWADKPQEMTTALSLANRSEQSLTLPLVAHASLNDENPLSLFVAAGAVSASTEIEIRCDAAVNPSVREANTHDPASNIESYPDLAWPGRLATQSAGCPAGWPLGVYLAGCASLAGNDPSRAESIHT